MIKKKCYLLAFTLMLFISFTDISALSGIDLSRVKFSVGERKVLFTFGDMQIEGLIHQEHPFTQEEILKIVKETLSLMKLTQSDIVELNRKVEKASHANDFTQADYDQFKDNVITTMNVVPAAGNAATVLDVINKYMSSKSWDDIGTVSVDNLANSMSDKVKSTAKGYIENEFGEMGEEFLKKVDWKEKLLNVVNLCAVMADAHDRTAKKWKTIADGANAKYTLNQFYSTLQEKIEAYKYVSDQSGWHIDFDNAMADRSFSFYGVEGNVEVWYLDMHMEQKATNEYGSIVGHYSGSYTMTAENDLGVFKSQAGQALRNMEELALNTILDDPTLESYLKTTAVGSAYVSRTISGSCEAIIDEEGNIELTLNETSDNKDIDISGMEAELGYSVKTNGIIKNKLKIPIQISANSEELAISGNDVEISANAKLSNGQVFDFSQSLGSGSAKVAWDKEIWKHWDGKDKKLELW